MFKAEYKGKVKLELEGKTTTKFMVNLSHARFLGCYSEFLCEDGELKLVLIVERQLIDEVETMSIFIKSCNVKARISSKVGYETPGIRAGHTSYLSELVNIIDMTEDKYPPVVKSTKLKLYFLEIEITRENKQNKIYNLFDDTTIAADYEALMNNKDSSDVSIIIGDKIFYCHKLILSTRSPVFARMLEVDMLEKQKGLVAIEDVTPETFKFLLKYIYTGELYEDEINDKVNWMELMLAAEKYHVDGLKKICWKNITGNLSIDNAIDALILADRLNQHKLKELTAEFIVENKSKLLDTEKYKELIKNHELALVLLQISMK